MFQYGTTIDAFNIKIGNVLNSLQVQCTFDTRMPLTISALYKPRFIPKLPICIYPG